MPDQGSELSTKLLMSAEIIYAGLRAGNVLRFVIVRELETTAAARGIVTGQLTERRGRRRPDTQRPFMSGYADEAVAVLGVMNEGVNFINEPFSPRDRGRKVRLILDG